MPESGISPATSGPAGSLFEGQVGAFYLLSLLTGKEPRGLLGTTIERVAFQRASEGRPLDDVIVQAQDEHHLPAVLEIQVKRGITFTPTDQVFGKVISQIVQASRKPEFSTIRYELAIATARTSQKIDGAYQEVLTWARNIGDAATFAARIDRPGSANENMRKFVRTFKSHLRSTGSPDDDETAWRLLRRLQILIFDFIVQGSEFEAHVRERAALALHPDDTSRAGALWASLVELAVRIAATGGDLTRDRLIEEIRGQSFRLAGDRRYASARAALAEASRNSLADISDRIGNVVLTRHEHVAAVRTALDSSRYIEIRGDAGVGKSGVLKHFAEQLATEARVIVLNPWRTTPKGWSAMRAVIGFDGSARDLLSDFAADGGAILFVDNLDFFKDDEQRTVVDLIRVAADVPGFAVIATARRNFGIEEPSWLPADTLNRLGSAEPIVIGELSEDEVAEIRHADPNLAPLLADTHPARDVARNLFRLGRLATLPGDAQGLHTEIDMAEQWWKTADGKRDDSHRDRARLLKALAEETISCAESPNVRHYPPLAIDALVQSETLRDLGNDRVAFRHDVLREWAIGNLIHAEPMIIERLPLDRPASAALARGLELAARMALERATDGTQWQSLLDRVSREGTHGSWRRVALLALVRSEIGHRLLVRASGLLLANNARVLCELIRLIMAVDVVPASKLFAAIGIDPAMIPSSLNVPSGPSWYRLIKWLLSLEQNVPVAAIPNVVDLYTAWSIGMGGEDPLTPLLMPWFYQWLMEIETARDAKSLLELRRPFDGQIDHERIASLESDLRTSFLGFCRRTPELAVKYLGTLSQRHHRPQDVIRSILKFRGTLAQAAPAELAEFTKMALIPQQRHRDEEGNHNRSRGPFTHHDLDFLPSSPAQGPFFDLLIHAPQHGTALIRQLVDHAIAFYTGGREHGTDIIIISFLDGERTFPWTRSYAWSRESVDHYCVTSALMALEAWAHRRIESGEMFETVLADTLGPSGSPVTYLLVAVDIILSHWPKSRETAIPFVACPELLCLDRERHILENVAFPDLLGLKALEKEPVGMVSLDSLRKRVSRYAALDELLSKYAVSGPAEQREALTILLHRAAARLGPPNEQLGLRDPAFMVVHALNRLDPSNWREVHIPMSDGTQSQGREYMPPETERQQLAVLHSAAQDKWADFSMQTSVMQALDDSSNSSSQFAVVAVEWAQRAGATPERHDTDEDANEDEDWMRVHAVVSAATIAMRDGDAEFRATHHAWARRIFAQALQAKDDPVHRFRSGLRYNPVAIAFVGMIYALKDKSGTKEIRWLLEVTTRREPAAAYGLGAAGSTLVAIDERLLRAVLRCAFAACIQFHREWGVPEEAVTARVDRQRKRLKKAVAAELAWLADKRSEPDWPAFPMDTPRLRRSLRVRGGRIERDEPVPMGSLPEEYADHQAAAVWLTQSRGLVDMNKRPWLREMARTYVSWTAQANGVGLTANEEVQSSPLEWNDAYFDLLARILPGLALPEIEQLALELIVSLPDRSFYDILPPFLRRVDAVYFNDRGLPEPIMTSIRTTLANRLLASQGWKRLKNSRSASIETHIGPAIAVLFFNDYGFTQSAKCYLNPGSVDLLAPFLTVLETLVKSGPSYFVASVALNLLEVSPRSTHLPFIIAAARAWLESYSDDSEFWAGHGFGRRFCVWVEEVHSREPTIFVRNGAMRLDLDRVLAALVSLGVAEATRLEEALVRGGRET